GRACTSSLRRSFSRTAVRPWDGTAQRVTAGLAFGGEPQWPRRSSGAERDRGVEVEAFQDRTEVFGGPGAAGGGKAFRLVFAHENGFVGRAVGFDVAAPVAVGVADPRTAARCSRPRRSGRRYGQRMRPCRSARSPTCCRYGSSRPAKVRLWGPGCTAR